MGVDHRPRFHLLPREGWTNDPIGPIFWGGRYHLFHQANPEGAFWARPHWGHFASADLVHWEHLPIAMSPTQDGVDADGCYSGCIVDHDGVATMYYTGVRGAVGPAQQQATCVATSTDPDLRVWAKYPGNPVTVPPVGYDLLGFRDPFVWRDGDRWRQLVGSGIAGRGGALFLYASTDLRSWTFLGPALIGDGRAQGEDWTALMWECPALLPFGAPDGGGSVLLVSLHDETRTHYPVAMLGSFDGREFVPHRMQRMDFGPDYYAPCVMVDARGRRICWGWAWEARAAGTQGVAGWAGVLTLPRVLTDHGGRLGVEPLDELRRLRSTRLPVTAEPCADGWRAAGAGGDTIEVLVDIAPVDGPVGVRVRCSPDGAERTEITYDRARAVLRVDRDHASLDPGALGGVYEGPLALGAEPLRLRVFVDRSLVEVYANGVTVATLRIYPSRPDSLGVEVFGPGGDPPVTRFEAYRMGSVFDPPGARPVTR